MADTIKNQYEPDFVSPPGDTLLETIETIGMSQADLAKRIGRPTKTINEIIKGKTAITPDTAIQLERALRVPASFWNSREQNYREYLARNKEYALQMQQIDWLNRFPIKSMIDYGWLKSSRNKVSQLQELLNYFGVATLEAWESFWDMQKFAFRISPAFESDFYSLTAWLRRGELEAQQISCQFYDKKKFKEMLFRIRHLTTQKPEFFQNEMIELCAKAGVAVTFIKELPKTRISGATKWLSPHKALIQISLRYKTNDQFWFTFFHEAGHILLHPKQIILDNGEDDGAIDQQANEFASNVLIPKSAYQKFLQAHRYSKLNILDFALEIDVDPGIIVGRLQHDKVISFNAHNALKARFTWAN